MIFRSYTIFLFVTLLLMVCKLGIAAQFQTVKIISSDSPPLWFRNVPLSSCPNNIVCSTSSAIISSAVVTPSVWQLNKPIKISFRTKQFDKTMPVSIFLYKVITATPQSESSSKGQTPTYKYIGLIVKQHYVEPRKDYHIEFAMPSWIGSGQYLVTINTDWKTTEPAFQVQLGVDVKVNFNRGTEVGQDQVIPLTEETLQHEFTHGRSDFSKGNIRATGDGQIGPGPKGNAENQVTQGSRDLAPDNVRALLSTMDSTMSICAFCSASRHYKAVCDSILSSGESPLTTTAICYLAHLETLIQKLEFKYISLYSATNDEDSKSNSFHFLHESGFVTPFTPPNAIWWSTVNVQRILLNNFSKRVEKINLAVYQFFDYVTDRQPEINTLDDFANQNPRIREIRFPKEGNLLFLGPVFRHLEIMCLYQLQVPYTEKVQAHLKTKQAAARVDRFVAAIGYVGMIV
ncbi:hypothetical protein BKA69DRAFT_1036524 [Paraphysoderma sedebokerense]|nr:hypothetical protein BKA69DRAFT_1036524 [Paraphysoderma sedebokerense]